MERSTATQMFHKIAKVVPCVDEQQRPLGSVIHYMNGEVARSPFSAGTIVEFAENTVLTNSR